MAASQYGRNLGHMRTKPKGASENTAIIPGIPSKNILSDFFGSLAIGLLGSEGISVFAER